MLKLCFVIASLFLLFCCFDQAASHPEWERLGRAAGHETVPFIIALPQQNVNAFLHYVDEVSNPKSKHYTNYMSMSEILDMIAPAGHVAEEVISYIESHCPTARSQFKNMRDAIRVETTVDCIESLFSTQMATYKHSIYTGLRIRADEDADISIPSELEHHISMVVGLQMMELPRRSGLHEQMSIVDALTERNSSFSYTIPRTVRDLYNIPQGTAVNHTNIITQGVVEFSYVVKAPSLSDYEKFAELADEPFTNITTIVGEWDSNPDRDIESTLDIQYLYTMAPNAINYYISVADDFAYGMALQLFNMEDCPQVISLSASWPEVEICGNVTGTNCTVSNTYIQRSEVELAKVAGRGVSMIVADGDSGAPSEYNTNCQYDHTRHAVNPEYPASSKYVTSVSATAVLNNGSDTNYDPAPICKSVTEGCVFGSHEESAMPNNTYFHFTTGGGFSTVVPGQEFAAVAVDNFIAGDGLRPPNVRRSGEHRFNSSNRGYADVSAVGSRILTVRNGEVSIIEGTSASTPIFAGVVTLLNNYRANQGKKPLGLLNALLYQMSEEAPSAFNDITIGNNSCSVGVCCHYGYGCAKGWDPVTGLGTPNFEKMISYIEDLP